MAFTTSPQTAASKKHPKQPDSIRKVCFSEDRKAYETVLYDTLFNDEHSHLSFDCPKPLREAFNKATKANGSSTCHVLRAFIVSYLVANRYQKVCFNNTMRSPIMVENLVVPTYVKGRVRRLKTVHMCGFRGCDYEAVAKGVWREGAPLGLCEAHLSEAKASPKDWQFIEAAGVGKVA